MYGEGPADNYKRSKVGKTKTLFSWPGMASCAVCITRQFEHLNELPHCKHSPISAPASDLNCSVYMAPLPQI